jgi:hypothetical protein
MAEEQKLNYRYERWQGYNDDFFVSLTDAALRKHLKAYLEAQGICALTYSEMMEKARQVQEQQYEALQRFLRLDYWLSCDDPEVRIQPRTMAAYVQMKESK